MVVRSRPSGTPGTSRLANEVGALRPGFVWAGCAEGFVAYDCGWVELYSSMPTKHFMASHLETGERNVAASQRSRSLRLWLMLAMAGILAATQGYLLRNALSDDQAMYLDMARRMALGDWHAIFNGYWSPLYPFLLSLMMRIAPGQSELVLFQFLHVLFFLFAITAFWLLYREIGIYCTATGEWTLFAVVMLVLQTAWREPIGSPDVIVAGCMFLTARLVLILQRRPKHTLSYVALGLLLGSAYYVKAVLFPIGAVVFVIVLIRSRHDFQVAGSRLALAFAVFAIVAAPLITGISLRYHRLTYGEVGKITAAWFINGMPRYVNWVGDPIGGTPLRPPHIVANNPTTFSFSGAGTYPPWYEPTYWYEGYSVPFLISKAARTGLRGLVQTVRFPEMVLLYVLAIAAWPNRRRIYYLWPLLCLAAAPVIAYCFIVTQRRYISGSVAVAAVCLVPFIPVDRTARKLSLWLVTLLAAAAILRSQGRLNLQWPERENFALVAALRASGLKEGANVAIIGDSRLARPQVGASYYGLVNELWAWIAKFRIVGEISPEGAAEFDALDDQRKAEILGIFASNGAAYVIAVNHPPAEIRGWTRVQHGKLTVYSPGPR